MKNQLYNISRYLYIGILMPCLFWSFSLVQAQAVISIDEVVGQTVANNPQFKVSLQKLEFSKGGFRIARSAFNTNLIFNGSNSRESIPYSLDGSPDNDIELKYWSYSLSAARKISFGTVITPSIGVFNSGQDILYDQLGGTLANQGTASISIKQPLLRGLGTTYNTAELRIAKLDINSQEHRYLFAASALLLDALGSYVEYIAAQLNLQIQQETEDRMAETVRQMTRLVELDAMPGSELVVSEANLANQRTNTSLAKNRFALSQNLLATSMGTTIEEVQSIGIPPFEFPFGTTLIIIDEDYTNFWMGESMQHRHDYLATTNDLEASIIGLDFSKKGMLPGLNLTFGAGYNGLSQAQGFDQFYKPYLSNIPGMNYNIGLTFDIAPRYDLQKGQRTQALALNETADGNLKYLQLHIKKEVRRDCDLLKYLLGATKSVNEAVEFSLKALENEKKKLDLGFSTAFNVALMQNSYLNTLERHNGLLQQLNQAILQFKYHTGTLLDATGNNTFSVNSNQLFLLPEAP